MVRIESLHLMQAKFRIQGRAMAQAASHRPQRPHCGGTDSILGSSYEISFIQYSV